MSTMYLVYIFLEHLIYRTVPEILSLIINIIANKTPSLHMYLDYIITILV